MSPPIVPLEEIVSERIEQRGARTAWPLIARLSGWEERQGRAAIASGNVAPLVYEFIRFTMKQGWASLFGGLLLGLIIGTRLWYPRDALLPRYDTLVIAAIVAQVALLVLRMETLEEAKVILLFHVTGTVMEVFKTATGSWIYPEPGYLKIWHVPLFTGFMYGAIGSYIARAWRLFDLQFSHHPPLNALLILSAAIYLNFFTDHWGIDLRVPLILATIILFGRTTVYFRVWRIHRRMPLLLGFFLVALFIWCGENLGTASHAWIYPAQAQRWSVVPFAKLESWFLLMLISYTMVAGALRKRDAIGERR